MKSFDGLDARLGLVPSEIVMSLRTVDAASGRAGLDADVLPGLLATLADRARAASVVASAELDGVVVQRRRAEEIVDGRVGRLHGRPEQELAGCRDVFDAVSRDGARALDVDLVLDLHRLLLAHTPTPGGRLKRVENVVMQRPSRRAPVKRFTPVPVAETPEHLDELIVRYGDARAAGRHHPVLLTGLFTLDLLAIHPFTVGNGRVARALTHLLLRQAGYDVTRYVSLDEAFARSADVYATALLDSTADWHTGAHDPWPWLRHLTASLADCSARLVGLVEAARTGGTKQERVRTYVLQHAPTTFRIRDVRDALPDVSDQTIRLVLTELRDDGLVAADGVGRSAAWSTVRATRGTPQPGRR